MKKQIISMLLATGMLFLGLFFGMNVVQADGASSSPDPVPANITRLVETEQFDKAIVELSGFVKTEKKNADAWNLLGYSQRKTGDLDNSLVSYKKALKIDKKHLGANEYLGELYLMQGDIKKAEKQLKRLAKYCGQCSQYNLLKASIKNAKSN